MQTLLSPYKRLAVVIVALLSLFACAHNTYAPVVDLQPMQAVMSGSHTVQAGENLYSISVRYARDYRELAASNNIPAPYILSVGQTIHLAPQIASPAPASPSAPAQNAATVIAAPSAQPIDHWQWPAQGELIAKFSSKSNGLKIAGQAGDKVVAAADGRVVYSGAGLRGYGQLIIIKHNDTYLTAYAHNQRLLVNEGEHVTRGTQIAEMGDTEADSVRLHFEIRREGSPIDPLSYLPEHTA